MEKLERQNVKSGPGADGTAFLARKHQGWRLNATAHALLVTYSQILVKGKKHYCQPRPDTTIDLLQSRHKITIKRRWFFQSVRNLVLDGFLTRKRRPRVMPDHTIRSKPSLWSFTFKGAQYLCAKAVEGSKSIISAMINHFKDDDHRYPGPSDILPGEEIMERSAALARLQELIEKIGRGPAGGTAPATTN